MPRQVRIAPSARRRPIADDFPAPEVRVRLRAARGAGDGRDDLRAARGVLAGALLGAGLWAMALLIWLSAR